MRRCLNYRYRRRLAVPSLLCRINRLARLVGGDQQISFRHECRRVSAVPRRFGRIVVWIRFIRHAVAHHGYEIRRHISAQAGHRIFPHRKFLDRLSVGKYHGGRCFAECKHAAFNPVARVGLPARCRVCRRKLRRCRKFLFFGFLGSCRSGKLALAPVQRCRNHLAERHGRRRMSALIAVFFVSFRPIAPDNLFIHDIVIILACQRIGRIHFGHVAGLVCRNFKQNHFVHRFQRTIGNFAVNRVDGAESLFAFVLRYFIHGKIKLAKLQPDIGNVVAAIFAFKPHRLLIGKANRAFNRCSGFLARIGGSISPAHRLHRKTVFGFDFRQHFFAKLAG